MYFRNFYGRILLCKNENTFFTSLLIQKNRLLIQKEVKIMNKYESVIIINPNLDEEATKAVVTKFSDLINTDGKVEKVEELGKKKLAYEVKKNTEGYYTVYYFEANPSLIAELERNYRITDEVIKFMTIKNED